MRVVQIVGPSYSGSTALGYILNAEQGWFFGSEIYRLLPSFVTDQDRARRARCTYCGSDCPYWHQELLAAVAALPESARVADVYPLFAEAHPETTHFVDGSKGARWYQDAWQGTQVLAAKHPLRMAGSHLYNRASELGMRPTPPFERFRRRARQNREQVARSAGRMLEGILAEYRGLLAQVPDGYVCRTDQLHLDGFAEFTALAERLDTSADPERVTGFSRYDVHPIGGNRSLVWQQVARGGQGRAAEFGNRPDRDKPAGLPASPRRDYYSGDGGSLGDYRVDDKHVQTLPTRLVADIKTMDSYQELCELLGYSLEPHVEDRSSTAQA